MSMQRFLNQKRDIPMIAEEGQSRDGKGKDNDLPDLPKAPEKEAARPEIGPEGYRIGELVDYVDSAGVRFKALPIQKFAGRPDKQGRRPYVHLGSPATIEFVLRVSDIERPASRKKDPLSMDD